MTVPPRRDPRWRKAARSQNEGACVDLHPDGFVRDSKNPDGGQLRVRLDALVAAIKSAR